MNVIKHTDPLFSNKLARLCSVLDQPSNVAAVVAEIIAAVETKKDRAVLAYTEQFDGAKLKARALMVTAASLAEAPRVLTPKQRRAIREAIKCVKAFHKQTLPKSWRAKNPHGATVGETFYPINRVGLYIPGGQVPLVSSVIMSAVLAKIAGVPEIAVATPPQADGSVNPGLLAALNLCGITEVYKVGGVQAIAALALGTPSIPAVDKIFGPGNAYVMEAKRQLYGRVGVDLLPGPSEVMIIADAKADAGYVACDLMAQAEHGTGKEKLYLAVTSEAKLKAIERELEKQIDLCAAAPAIRAILKSRFHVFVCKSMKQVIEVTNKIAPEHLELQVAADQQNQLVQSITTAGAILLGAHTPTALGDFTAGPSHTLPTDRTGRFSGGMQLIDFMRRSSVVKYDAKSIEKAAPVVAAFAELEQLDTHGRSVSMRL